MTKNKLIPTLNVDTFKQTHFSSNEELKKMFVSNYEAFLFHRLEDTIGNIKLPLPPHRKTVYDFIYITKGTAERTFGLATFTLREGQFFFMPSNQITSTPYISPNVEGFYCHFSSEFLHGFEIQFEKLNLFKAGQNPVISVEKTQTQYIHTVLGKIEEEYLSFGKNRRETIAVNLLALFFELEKHTHQTTALQTVSSSERITGKFKQLLQDHILEFRKASDYAEMLNITPNHLNKCVKNATGRPVVSWVNDMLLLESKILLSQSDLTISEISAELSFDDISYFSRFFKSHTGISPTTFRKNKS